MSCCLDLASHQGVAAEPVVYSLQKYHKELESTKVCKHWKLHSVSVFMHSLLSGS